MGTARVADDGIPAEIFYGRVRLACDRCHGGAGFQYANGPCCDFEQVLCAAARGADKNFARKSRFLQIAVHVLQMFLHEGLQRGVDRRRRSPPVFANDRYQLVREGVRDPRQFLIEIF